jgi:hypothetical protein
MQMQNNLSLSDFLHNRIIPLRCHAQQQTEALHKIEFQRKIVN